MEEKHSGILRRLLASPYLLLVLATLSWAGNSVVGREAHAHIPIPNLAFWRWVVAFCILLPFGLPAVRKDWEYYRANWGFMMLLGVLGISAAASGVYWALAWTTAINVSIVSVTMPPMIFLLSWVIERKKATPSQIGGLLLALLGALFAISNGDFASLLKFGINFGDGLMFAAVTCLGIYSVLVKRVRAGISPVGLLTVLIFFGLLGIAPFYAWSVAHGHFFLMDVQNVEIFVYVGLFPSLVSFLCWNTAIARGGARVAGMFYFLTTVFTTVLAVPILGETLTGSDLAGMALIFCGIYLATFYRRSVSKP